MGGRNLVQALGRNEATFREKHLLSLAFLSLVCMQMYLALAHHSVSIKCRSFRLGICVLKLWRYFEKNKTKKVFPQLL